VRYTVPSTKLINNQAAEEFRRWTPRELLKGGEWQKAYSKYDYMLRLECGCFVEFMSYEMDLDKFGGSPRHRCHYDEEPPKDIREECFARLTDYNGKELFTMTPLKGMTWMFDEVWLSQDPGVFTAVASVMDNPNISEEGVVKMVRKYAAWPQVLAARVFGRFVHFGGMVYPQWREWLVAPPDRDWIQQQDIVCGLDPGARGFGHAFLALDSERRQFLFHAYKISGESPSPVPNTEYRPEGANVKHSVDAIKRICDQWGLDWRSIRYVMDPSGRARSPIMAETVETQYQELGIFPERGDNDLEAGILNTRQRGQYDAFFVSETNTEPWQWEAERYRIDEDRKDGGFAVIKEEDHVMDAQRYGTQNEPFVIPEDRVERQLSDDVAQPPRRRGAVHGPAGALA
jgi:phage terminase large subunit-like protein